MKDGRVKYSRLDTKVSCFRDVFHRDDPEETTIAKFLQSVQQGKYRQQIEAVRAAKDDSAAYYEIKKKLPSVTLSAQLTTRREEVELPEKLIRHSNIIQVDIDKLGDRLHTLKEELKTDPYILFVFDSPGADGLKGGIPIDGTRHLESYHSIARYFQKKYGVKIDPKVKDVARLCFVSYDPDLSINEDAKVFPISSNGNGNTSQSDDGPIPKSEPLNRSDQQKKHGERALDTARKMIERSPDGEKLNELLKAANLLGGYVAGGMLSQSEAVEALRDAIRNKPNVACLKTAYKAIDDGIRHGQQTPISFEELERQRLQWLQDHGYTGSDQSNGSGQRQPDPKESPRPLTREIPPPEPYPVDALGEVLAGAAQAIHEVIQSPLGLCCQSVLAAAALAVQPHGNLEVDGRTVPLSEYFMTVAISGERKSAGDDVVLLPHRQYEVELEADYKRQYSEFANADAAYRKAKEEALKKAKGYAAKKAALDELGDPPISPATPIITMQEPTFEGLFKAMLCNRPSIGIFNDEAGTFIGGHALNEENRKKTAAGLCHLWDAKAVSRVRGGDGVAVLKNRRFSMHLMAQPSIACAFLNDPLLIDQGLLSRVLTTWPTSTVGARKYKEADLSADPDIRKYYERMTTILHYPLPTSDEDDKELQPPKMKLTAEAKSLWIEFHDLVESQLSDEAPLSPIRGFGNKAPQHALRLAGILALVEGQRNVNHVAMANGIELTQYYLAEALRLFHSGMVDPQLEQAQKLLDWLSGREYIDLPTIYQRGPGSIRDSKLARCLVDILAAHGWLTPIKGGMEIDGKYRREVWEVASV